MQPAAKRNRKSSVRKMKKTVGLEEDYVNEMKITKTNDEHETCQTVVAARSLPTQFLERATSTDPTHRKS